METTIEQRAASWRAWHERNYQLWKSGGKVDRFYGSHWPAKEREFQKRLKDERVTQQAAQVALL